MKILMTTTTFPRSEDDIIPQFLLGLAQALVRAGAAVTVIAPHDKTTRSHEFMGGVEIRRVQYWIPKSAQGLCYGSGIPTNIRRNKWVAAQFPALEAAFLQAIVRWGRAADVFNPHWTFAGVPTALAAQLMGKPMVTHAYSAEYLPKALNAMNRYIVGQSQAVISISEYTKTKVEAVVIPKQHHVIGYGVNPQKIASDDVDNAAFRQSIGIADDETFIFAVGRLVERKGYHVLVDAVAKLVQQGRKVRLLQAGRGVLHDQLQAQIDAHGISEQAQLIGFVPDAELVYYLKSADMLVMPSIMDKTGDTEGLGIPPLEAMANGTPAIASDIGGLKDVLDHEHNALAVPPHDVDALAAAISRLIDDPDLAQRLIAGGYETVNHTYAWDTIAAQNVAVFEDAIRMRHA